MSSQKRRNKADGDENSTALVPTKGAASSESPDSVVVLSKKAAKDKATKAAEAAAAAAERRAQKKLAILGFATLGLLMGFLWGANLVVQVTNSSDSLVQAVRVGTAVATNTVAWIRGISLGIVGALLGGSFGFSLFLIPRHMVIGLVSGTVGLALGAWVGGALLGGVGWSACFLGSMFALAKNCGIRV